VNDLRINTKLILLVALICLIVLALQGLEMPFANSWFDGR